MRAKRKKYILISMEKNTDLNTSTECNTFKGERRGINGILNITFF